MKHLSLLIIYLGMGAISTGQNPLVKDVGMSDPHMKVYGDTLYLYCGFDNHPDDRTWVMKEWRVFTSTNLLNWKLEGNISPGDNYMGENSTDCWAGDAASHKGKYFFYFSDRKRGIGVMSSEFPAGPFKDALRKPLVSPLHDPTILVDDDPEQTHYIVYGDKSDSYYIAKLGDDMISLAENPKAIRIIGDEWEMAPDWMDKNYVFKYRDRYYLTWGRDYAIAENPYGPYHCVGAVGEGFHLDEYAHGSFFWWKGQFYHIWCYYLREGYKYRESIITYCHFDEKGGIVSDTDFLDQHFSSGVGQYDASWPLIEAEWYNEISPGIAKMGNREDGFVLSGTGETSWVKFSHVNFEENYQKFEARIALSGSSGLLEIRADSVGGKMLGSISLNTKEQADWQNFSLDIKEILGKKDILVLFKGAPDFNYELDWIKFRK